MWFFFSKFFEEFEYLDKFRNKFGIMRNLKSKKFWRIFDFYGGWIYYGIGMILFQSVQKSLMFVFYTFFESLLNHQKRTEPNSRLKITPKFVIYYWLLIYSFTKNSKNLGNYKKNSFWKHFQRFKCRVNWGNLFSGTSVYITWTVAEAIKDIMISLRISIQQRKLQWKLVVFIFNVWNNCFYFSFSCLIMIMYL